MCWQPFEIFKGSNWAQCFVNAAEAQETGSWEERT